MVDRLLPKRRNPLVAPGTAPRYEDLLARRRLGKTKLTVKPGQVGTSNATKAENLGPFEYAHLRAPLPDDLKGSEIFAVQANQPPPETYFLMRRSKDGFISATGMFKIAFPWAAHAEERAERAYLKTLAATSQDEVAGNIWVEPGFALALARDYGLYEWIRALLDPTDIVQSPSSARKQIAPPPKFEFLQEPTKENDRTRLPPPTQSEPLRSRLRSASPSKGTASPVKKAAPSPRKRQTKKEKEAAIANANAASASLQSSLDDAASVAGSSTAVDSTTTSPVLNDQVAVKVEVAIDDDVIEANSHIKSETAPAQVTDELPVSVAELPSPEDGKALLESARQMSSPKIKRKRKVAEAEPSQPAKKAKVQAQEEVVKRDKVRTRAFVGLTATLAIALRNTAFCMPSLRVAAYLARRNFPTMALIATDLPVHDFQAHTRPGYPPPPVTLPEVSLTPVGDPWPRPYYLERGLRRVAPYHYTYNTFCKQRWRGRTLLDVFASEFRDRDREYYKNAIETGQITINGQACVDLEAVVKNGDVISHTLHRHEPPVTAQPIRTIHEDDDVIVIDKPAGVPVHPAGRYKFNSVVEIMRAERHRGFNPLPVNRLDRLTSGVMFIGKHPKSAEALSNKLRGRTVRKEYVARVKGRFPDGDGDDDGEDGKPGVVTCDEPILSISPILGLNRARASGKRAKTLFKRDHGYSIVHCLPLTGRTHQIRVHLQFLGHPITNDPIYSNRRVFGPDLGKNDSSGEHDQEIVERLNKMGKTELAGSVDYGGGGGDGDHERDVSKLVDQTQQMTVSELRQLQSGKKPLPQTLHAGAPPPNGHDYSAADPKYAELVKAHDEMVDDYNRRKGEKMTGDRCQILGLPQPDAQLGHAAGRPRRAD
ncbi:hypothetical protein DV738_g5003, partial [Chaetothyriales sp. CBS 135597]